MLSGVSPWLGRVSGLEGRTVAHNVLSFRQVEFDGSLG